MGNFGVLANVQHVRVADDRDLLISTTQYLFALRAQLNNLHQACS